MAEASRPGTVMVRKALSRRRGPSRLYGFLVHQAQRAPWWTLSLTIHIGVLVLLWWCPCDSLLRDSSRGAMRVRFACERMPQLVGIGEPLDVPVPEEVDGLGAAAVAFLEIPPVEPAESLPDVSALLGDVLIQPEIPELCLDPPAYALFAVEVAPFRAGSQFFAPRAATGRRTAAEDRGGTSRRAEAAVRAGLLWLAAAQEKDGSWRCARWGGGEDYDVGVTGLALLAFLGAGHTESRGPYRATVGRALGWLAANQCDDGRFRCRSFYEHGIATLAVCDAYGLGGSRPVARVAQRAVDCIVRVQPEHGGFRYDGAVAKEEGDLSVTGWQILALRSALCSGLGVPPRAIERARVFLANTYRGDGASAYLVGNVEPSPAMTAVGMLCRQLLGGGYAAEIQAAADHLLRRETQSGGAGEGRHRLVGDLYYTYYATTAMFQFGGEYWAAWNRLVRDPLANAQVSDAADERGQPVRGSWDPRKDYWGPRGGRVYTTALALLSLEVYYRFLPVRTACSPGDPSGLAFRGEREP